jgi:hypothetical protein
MHSLRAMSKRSTDGSRRIRPKLKRSCRRRAKEWRNCGRRFRRKSSRQARSSAPLKQGAAFETELSPVVTFVPCHSACARRQGDRMSRCEFVERGPIRPFCDIDRAIGRQWRQKSTCEIRRQGTFALSTDSGVPSCRLAETVSPMSNVIKSSPTTSGPR